MVFVDLQTYVEALNAKSTVPHPQPTFKCQHRLEYSDVYHWERGLRLISAPYNYECHCGLCFPCSDSLGMSLSNIMSL